MALKSCYNIKMIIKITAHANNKRNTVEKDMFDEIHVYTSVRPKDGEASK